MFPDADVTPPPDEPGVTVPAVPVMELIPDAVLFQDPALPDGIDEPDGLVVPPGDTVPPVPVSVMEVIPVVVLFQDPLPVGIKESDVEEPAPVPVAVPFEDPVFDREGGPESVWEAVGVRLPSLPVMKPEAVLFHPPEP